MSLKYEPASESLRDYAYRALPKETRVLLGNSSGE